MFRFGTRAGRGFIERSEYTLANEEGHTIEESSWESAMISGSVIFMAAIIKKAQPSAEDSTTAACPKCGTVDTHGEAERVLQWRVHAKC